MKTRFIVLIDFSSYSKFELQLAKHWAESMAADVLLLHEPVIMAPALTDDRTRNEISKYETDKALNKLKAFAVQHLPNTRQVSYHVADGSVILSLQRLLSEYYYNVVFVGLKGTGFLKRIFMGSTAICRILHLFGDKIKHICFLAVVTQKDSAKQTIAYLEEPRKQYCGESNAYIEMFKREDAFYTLKQRMDAHADGMLVVQKGSRSFTNQVFRRFLINELVYDASIPLIVLPEESARV